MKHTDLQPTVLAVELADTAADIPADLVYTSGSSLDPHISLAAARAQIERVAGARGVEPQNLERLITENTDGRALGIFGEPGINVLKLNLALDALQPS